MLIRWLNAFRGRDIPLSDVLDHELEPGKRERAAEWLSEGQPSCMGSWCHVGLVFNKTTIARKFKGDVWSLASTPHGRIDSLYLFPTRRSLKNGDHSECFIRMGAVPSGIVLSAKNLKKMPKESLDIIYAKADEFNLPVYVLTGKGELKLFY